MGMYCCCDEKISSPDFECLCDWDGWISTCDYPPERKNKQTPISLPPQDGIYLTRTQTGSADRYEAEKRFHVIPRVEKGGYFGPPLDHEIHWEGESWEEGKPYAWKEKA